MFELEMMEAWKKVEAREGKDVVTLEVDFGGKINRSWRRMECGYPGLGTWQIIKKNVWSNWNQGRGGRKKKKKISQIFGFHNKEEGYCCFQRRWGRSLERKIHFWFEHIKYKMAIAHHVTLTVEYASGEQKGSLNWRLQLRFHKNIDGICGYEMKVIT